jgi:prepilin signal peptidase PulO-like enzyme (type II secretory pathway)
VTTTRSDAPWDLSFLRVGALVTGIVAVGGALVTGVLAGWDDALGVLLGAAVVTTFFVVSGVAIAWAGRIDDTFTLPAALGAFFVKAVLLYAVLSALPEEGWLDRRTLAFAVVAGALLWSVVQLRWVWTRQLYYVPPPVPPSARRDQEGPEQRG